MSLRGAAAIIGIGELNPERRKPGRTGLGLVAEAAKQCIIDSGLDKSEVDGLITEVTYANTTQIAEYLGMRPTWAHSVNMMGSSGAMSVGLAAAAIHAGLATNVLCVVSSGETPGFGQNIPEVPPYLDQNFHSPYGPGPGANFHYALIATRYAEEYGLTDEDRVSIAVQQRENALANPDAVFYGQPITTDDVLNSRMIADPLRILECVMPCMGAAAVMVTSAERARTSPHPPVYMLGVGQAQDRGVPGIPFTERPTTSPVAVSAKAAFRMSGTKPADMGLVSIYDCYTITVLIELEDAGFCPKGEAGPFVASTDVTYKGTLPINTHGGQLSFGQPGVAGGMSHVTEAVRQMMGRCGERQVQDLDYCFVNG